ncbi:MAG: TonB-dependent receptor, partial [Acidobacteriia bacterium]|nr:TonB-dependent receptor [Terriglobia bacterium]
MRSPPLALCLVLGTVIACAQESGSVHGTVRLQLSGEPVHNAIVTILPLGRNVETTANGDYEITNLPPGSYTATARLSSMAAPPATVQIKAGGSVTLHFELAADVLKQSITVTASGKMESTQESFLPVTSVESLDLSAKSAPSLGEVLEGQPGIAKRSGGPGSTRPVIRGYDGDRVLVLEDGIRTGSLSSSSGDHGEPIDPNSLERIEVVRGPSTLLYGSNAIGGVVNAISSHDLIHQHPHEGLKGYATGLAGAANANAGGSAGLEYGFRRWLLWGNGGGQRTGEYNTPIGRILNSQTRSEQAAGGFSHYGDKSFFSLSYGINGSQYGVPLSPEKDDAEAAVLAMRRHSFRFNGGAKKMGAVLDRAQFTLSYSDYNHKELVLEDIESHFFNKQFIYRGVFEQDPNGRLLGSFGFWGMRRDFRADGADTISPPVDQNAFAVFAVESLDFEKTRVQFGGRLEHTAYQPQQLQARSFTGFSGSAGVSRKLAGNTVLVGNFSHSYRAPALEELYNHGPHPGNATYEIGNSNLLRERSDGLDLSIRHQSAKLRAEAGYFYYRNTDYVYLAPTGRIQKGLPEADYLQAGARYTGMEARLDAAIRPSLWMNLGLDVVKAQLTESSTPLPRIPPVRGMVGLDYRWKGLSVRPELVLAARQSRVFTLESPTAGYALLNLAGSYTVVRQHSLHVITATLFNSTDRLYRNHLSFIKAFAPEIG